MSYSDYTQENGYMHPDRVPHGAIHTPIAPKPSLESHPDRAFEYGNHSPFNALFRPDQSYVVTTPGTWSSAGGETSRFQGSSGVHYGIPAFEIPRTPSSSLDSTGMAATAAVQHDLYRIAAAHPPPTQLPSAEFGAWFEKKKDTYVSRDKVLPQPNISLQQTAVLPTPPMSTHVSNPGAAAGAAAEGWSEEPERQTHWRQSDIPIPMNRCDSGVYNNRSDAPNKQRRASASASNMIAHVPGANNIPRHGSMDQQPQDPTEWWKRDQSSLSGANQYRNHYSFQDSLTAASNDSRRYPEPEQQRQRHEDAQTNDRPTKKRSPNAFFLFCSERRHKIRAEQPKIRNSDLNRLLGQEWNSLSEESKMHYKQCAELRKEQGKESVMTYSMPASIISPAVDRRTSEDDGDSMFHFRAARHLSSTETCPSGQTALFVSANHDSHDQDWQSSSNITSRHDNSSIEETEANGPSPRAITGGRNVVNVASHSAAAEAEALANLTRDGLQMDETYKRLPHRRSDQKPERLKRPPNAYLLFNRDMRHKILNENANLSVAEISKLISGRWNNLSQDEKEYYNREAAKLKQQHMDDHPNFIYSRRSKAELAEAGYQSRPAKKRKSTVSPKPLTERKGRDPRGRKKKRLKNPTAPKHPMSGFLFYSTSVRAEIAASMQKPSVGDISKVIADRWRKMDTSEQAPWNKKAEEDKARYAREMEDFISSLEVQETQGRASGDQRVERPRSPVELDSQTIATVAQMVNPTTRQSEMMLPPSTPHNQQYQVLPATPPHLGN